MINDVVNTGIQPAVNAKVSTVTTEQTALATEQAAVKVKPESVPAESKNAVPDSEKLNQAVSKLNDYVQNIRRTLSFSISETTGQTIIEVYDAETEELIRQIPPEKTVQLAENLADISADSGFFVKERA